MVIERLPAGRPFLLSRSSCTSCGKTLGPRDLIPMLSFCLARGRCRHCKAAIAPFHLAIELAALTIAALCLVTHDEPAQLWGGCALGWWLLTLAWIDFEHFILPDELTLTLLLAGLGWTLLAQTDAVLDHALGSILGFGSLWLVAAIYRRLRNRDGLGSGDPRMLAAGGAWLGWEALPWVICLAAMAGLVLAVVRQFVKGDTNWSDPLPFGPALSIAIWAVWMFGGPL